MAIVGYARVSSIGQSLEVQLDRLAHCDFETEIRAERQLEGIEKAKARGVAFGRRRSLSEQAVRELKQKRKSGVKIADLIKEEPRR